MHRFSSTAKPHFMDTRLTQTPCYYRQFTLSLGNSLPYIFSKFNLLNSDTSLIWTLSMSPSVSILTEFDCIFRRAVVNQESVYCLLLPTTQHSACENSWHFPTWPLASSWNDIWRMTVEIPLMNCVTTQIWVVLFWVFIPPGKIALTNQKHNLDLGSDMSSVWNFNSH